MGANFSKRKQKNTEKMTGNSNVISNDEKLCVSNENSIPRASLCYFVHLDSTKEPKAPPKLSRLHQNTRSSIEDISELTMMADSLEEKQFIATILREENLYVKGKSSREFTRKHSKVIQRKVQISEDKRQQILEKMVMNEMRVHNQPRMPRRMRSNYRLHKSRSTETSKTTMDY